MAATTHIPHDFQQPTLEVSPLPPHQQRVIEEKNELDERIAKLAAFVQPTNIVFNGLPVAEAGRLIHQLAVMNEYSDVLGKRIEAFE